MQEKELHQKAMAIFYENDYLDWNQKAIEIIKQMKEPWNGHGEESVISILTRLSKKPEEYTQETYWDANALFFNLVKDCPDQVDGLDRKDYWANIASKVPCADFQQAFMSFCSYYEISKQFKNIDYPMQCESTSTLLKHGAMVNYEEFNYAQGMNFWLNRDDTDGDVEQVLPAIAAGTEFNMVKLLMRDGFDFDAPGSIGINYRKVKDNPIPDNFPYSHNDVANAQGNFLALCIAEGEVDIVNAMIANSIDPNRTIATFGDKQLDAMELIEFMKYANEALTPKLSRMEASVKAVLNKDAIMDAIRDISPNHRLAANP